MISSLNPLCRCVKKAECENQVVTDLLSFFPIIVLGLTVGPEHQLHYQIIKREKGRLGVPLSLSIPPTK